MKQAMKYAWIATNFFLLQLVLGTYVLYPDYSFTNNETIVYLILLSFPSSVPAAVLAASFLQGYPPLVSPPFDYIVICLVVFIAGYLQWFWCIPWMVKEPEIISLQLANPNRETHLPAAKPTRRRKSSRSNLPRAPFDRTGHSPLERAIGIKRG